MESSASQDVLVEGVREKVGRWLVDFVGSYEVGQGGIPSFRFGSSRIFVDVKPWGDENVLVKVWSFLLRGVDKSPELNEWIAYNTGNFFFGSVFLIEDPDDTSKVGIIMDHSLLGDAIDPEELREAVGAIAHTSDELDTTLQQKFGGELFHEDSD